MSQKLPVNNFKRIKDTSQFNEDFIKTIMKKMIKDIFLKLMLNILKNCMKFIMIYYFLHERMKIEKAEKLVDHSHGKTEYVIHIKKLKQALNHGLVSKKAHRVIKFNQNAWLKPYINMNTDLRKKEIHDFEKTFFKLMNDSVFGKKLKEKGII